MVVRDCYYEHDYEVAGKVRNELGQRGREAAQRSAGVQILFSARRPAGG